MKLVVTGTGDYTGTVKLSYKITPLKTSFSARTIAAKAYDPQGVTLTEEELGLRYGETGLREGLDYKITYKNNRKAGSAGYTVTFLGNFKGSSAVRGNFTIDQAALSDTGAVILPNQLFRKKGLYAAAPTVTAQGELLKNKKDYTVSYYFDEAMTKEITKSAQIEDGSFNGEESLKVYVKITGKGGNYKAADAITGSYEVVKKSVCDLAKEVRISFVDEKGSKLTKAAYTGEEVTPTVKIEVKKDKKWQELTGADRESFDASVDYLWVNNVNKGKAALTITGREGSGYTGSISGSFTITATRLAGK